MGGKTAPSTTRRTLHYYWLVTRRHFGLFALLVLSIRRSTTLATAMEARGFGGDGPRSHARVSTVDVLDWVYLGVCLAIPVIALITAVCAGSFSFLGQ